MNNDKPDWLIPFGELFDEKGYLRPLTILTIEKATEIVQGKLNNLTEDDAPMLAVAIAETSLGLRWLNRGITLGEGTLKNHRAKLTESEQRDLQQEVKRHQDLASKFREHFEVLLYSYAVANGEDVKDW